MIHCYEAPRSLLPNYFDQSKYLEVLLGKSGAYKSKFYPKPYVELKYGACILKNKVSAHSLGLLVQLTIRVAPPYGHGVSKVGCKWLEGKSMFLPTLYYKVTKSPFFLQKRIDPLYIGPR